MSVKWNAFFSRVMPEVKGCPAPIAVQAIRDAAREWCERTWVWQEVVPYETVEDSREVLISVPSDSRLVSVLYLIDEGQKKSPDGYTIRANSNPVETEDEQTETAEMEARVVLKPSEAATECSDFLYNGYAEEIGWGAKARLLYNPSKPWGNMDMAGLNFQMFRKAIAQEKIKLSRGYTNKSLKVKARRFI